MIKFYPASIFCACILSLFVISCDSNSGKQFENKEDSVTFAKAVLEKYSLGQPLQNASRDTTPAGEVKGLKAPAMAPIDRKTILTYSLNYDKNPAMKDPAGFYYQGFSIDTAGYGTLIKTTAIKGLYLRLGRRDDGSYTIMVLGTDKDGKIISSYTMNRNDTTSLGSDVTDFDALPPCPSNCP